MTPEQAYDHCFKHSRNAECEKIILTDPEWAYFYARDVTRGRWKQAESVIATDTEYAYFYARYVIKGRWYEAEKIIATDPQWAYLYARDVIKGKLPENMHNAMLLHADEWAKKYLDFITKINNQIITYTNMTPEQAYYHCLKHGRNSKLEKIIATDPEYAYNYARDFIRGRWVEAENVIATNSEFAYFYARNIIRGRWIEGENVILTDPCWAYLYAREVIKGKLPENMHNAMIAHGIINPNDKNIKRYLKSKKYKTKQPV